MNEKQRLLKELKAQLTAHIKRSKRALHSLEKEGWDHLDYGHIEALSTSLNRITWYSGWAAANSVVADTERPPSPKNRRLEYDLTIDGQRCVICKLNPCKCESVPE